MPGGPERPDPDGPLSRPPIWDELAESAVDGSDHPEDGAEQDDPYRPPIPLPERQAEWLRPDAWIEAEGGRGRGLAALAHGARYGGMKAAPSTDDRPLPAL